MKGVLSIAMSQQKYVYQAVHMIFNGDFLEPWAKDEPRVSKLVFIGKNLDHKELTESFKACLAPPDFLERKKAALRFSVGTQVECKTGQGRSGWSRGSVTKLLYQDECMTPGQIAPYQVQLDDGGLIWAPEDTDELIRAV